jgi:DNA primase
MLADGEIDRVADAADIVQIIGEFVRLKRTGRVYRGPCPFHQGTNANFSVVPGGGYKCFVCGETGSVFTFVQKRLGLGFVDAVKYVAGKSGIEVRETRAAEREGPDWREPYWELMASAVSYFQETLWESEAGRAARAYLESRHVTRELADRFSLGMAPQALGLMRGHLNTLGFDDARQIEAGLLVVREEGSEPRPRFRSRLMFPIFDAQGHPIGFGGRAMEAAVEPKYLNSPETKLFSKGKVLYGYHWAKSAIRRAEAVILVEGYFDLLRLVSAGVEHVVAPLGTALTTEQAALIARSAKQAFLLYDSDMPGQKASYRAGDELLRHGVSVRVVTLPEGEDPDTFVDTHGKAALEAQLEAAMDVFDRKVQRLERGGWFADLHKRRRAIDHLLPTIRATTDPLMRELYLARASEVSGVARAVLEREVARGTGSGGVREARAAPAAPPAEPRTPPPVRESRRPAFPARLDPIERDLVSGLLRAPHLIERAVEQLDQPALFRDPRLWRIFSALGRVGSEVDIEALGQELDEEETAILNDLIQHAEAIRELEGTVEASVRRIQARGLERQLRDVQRSIAIARPDEQGELLGRKNRLAKELRELGVPRWKVFLRDDD